VPVLPIAAIAACLWLTLNLTWIRFGIWMVVGVLIYFAYGHRHSVLATRPSSAKASA
jgi:APA family basic amino acid/polyamine antiporter